jgi:3-hydroxy-9,10-secoandrosta-1,3,5(10)-triene-9,17-dione monooxygenase
MDDAGSVPSTAELVGRAEAIVPKLRERAAEAEANRRLPDVTIEEMRAAEFYRILKPKRFGGFGLTQEVTAEVVYTLAKGCGSSGWVSNLLMMHPWQVGLFELEAQEEVWNDEPEAFIGTASFSTKSEIKEVDGGFRLSGHWKFASGSDFASWFMIMKPSNENLDWMLVPRSDVEIVDDWYVSGLCATGSKDIILDDVFIPSHRTVQFDDLLAGNPPGAGLPDPVANAKLSYLDAVLYGNTGAVIGMGSGMIEAFEKGMVGKRSLITGELQIERSSNQIKLAEACADIDTALTVMRRRLGQLHGWSLDGYPDDPAERLAPHRDSAYVTQLVVRMATRLAIGAGANATYRKSPIQRFVRDILSGGSHAIAAWEDAAEPYGRARWGLGPKAQPEA